MHLLGFKYADSLQLNCLRYEVKHMQEQHSLPSGAIADFGCGKGTELCALKNLIPNRELYVGCDTDEYALASARTAFPSLNFIREDFTNTSLVQESFACVHSCHILDYAFFLGQTFTLADLVEEANRLLVSGGVFVSRDIKSLSLVPHFTQYGFETKELLCGNFFIKP